MILVSENCKDPVYKIHSSRMCLGLSFSAYRFFQLLLALSLALFIICFAIEVTLLFTPLYYADIQLLNIAEQSGINRARIIENYNYMIQYLLNPFPQVFDLPSLHYSMAGKIHFQDVKRIFVFIDFLLVVTGIISATGIWVKTKNRDFYFLKPAAVALAIFTVVPLIAFAIDFNGTFILFHKLFFRNNYWIFDPRTDPVITILPETFFLHAALLILGIIVLGIITLIMIYKKNKQKVFR